MKRYQTNSQKSLTTSTKRKVSRESLTTWTDVNERKKHEAKTTATKIMSGLLNKVDTIVGEDFSRKSSCSLMAESLEISGSKVLSQSDDKKLFNWTKWIRIREMESKKIARATLRNRRELLLNSNPNDFRAIMKEKEVIEKTKNNVGDLNFWRMPEEIKNDLFLTVPKSQKYCTPPEITFTQTPDVILKEQNIPIARSVATAKFLEITGKFAQPTHTYKPRMEKLAVCANIDSTSVESVLPKVESEIEEKPTEREQILIVNRCVLDGSTDILIDLTFDGFKYEKHSKLIKIENVGEMAVNIHFEKFNAAPDLPEFPADQSFFFEKLPFRIIPGETVEIQFHFFAKTFGIFNEKWMVKCVPPFMDTRTAIINLLGSCRQKHKRSELKCKEFKEDIVRKAAQQTVRKEIQDILELVIPIRKNHKKTLLCDDPIREIFLKSNPNLNYHSEAVDILSDIYEEVNESECEWNYNVNDLYKIILNIHHLDGKQKNAYHRFNDALQKLMVKNRLNVDCDEKLIKTLLIKINFGIFLDKLATDMEETNDISSIKRHLLNTLDKMVNILES